MKPLDPRLLPHLRPARTALLVACAASAVGGLLLVAQAGVVGSLVASLVLGREWTGWVPWVLLVFVLRAGASYAGDVASARAAGQVSAALRQRLLRAELDSPRAGTRLGELSALATRGITAIEPYLTRYVPALALAAVLPAVTVAAIAWLDWLSAVIVVATLPLVPMFAVLVGLSTRDRADKQWREMSGLAGHFLDVVRGLPTLVAFRRAKSQSASIREITDRYRRASLDTLKLAFASSAVLELIATLSVALVAVSVGLRLASGSLDLGTALIVLLLAPEAYWPIRRVGAEFHAAAEGTATFEACIDSLGSPHRQGEPWSRSRAPRIGSIEPPSIRLSDVTVGYPQAGRRVLDHFNAEIPARSLTVLVGPSGCGKSTLVQALLLEQPLEYGDIAADGTPVADLDWRAIVAQSPQRPWLTSGSIRANLLVGNATATDAELWSALDQVSMAAVVRALPSALDTALGEDGAGLSAGQHARLALARIVLAVDDGRRVVVLDEPTAHLDSDTERILIQTLRSLASRATVIAVAHSPALVAAADHVITLPARPTLDSTLPRPTSTDPRPASTVLRPEPTDPRPTSRFGLRTGLALGTAASASGVALTATAGWLIAKAAEHPPVLHLMVAIVGVRLFGLARPVLRYAERLVSHDAALRLLAERRAQVYDALVPLVPGRLGLHRGELLASLVQDVDAETDRHLRVRLPVITAIGVTLIGTLTGLAIQSLTGALLIAAVGLVAGVPAWFLAHAGAKHAEPRFLQARAQLWSRVTTLLHDARQLVLWGVTDNELAKVGDSDTEVNRALAASARASASARAWILLVTGGAVAVMAWLVHDSTITPAMQALLVLVPMALAEVLVPLADAATTKVRTDRAEQRLDVLTRSQPAVSDPQTAQEPPQGQSAQAENLSAGWNRAAFTGLDLDLRPGERVAVVGPSGCGKSTLAATLMRFIDPLEGTASLDWTDLKALRLDDVRMRIGLVDDDPYIFSSSIVENVRLARPSATDEEVAEATHKAHLGAWIDGQPHGLHTMIGDGHAAVSGGERARIGIARSLLADQRVLVLDEPTAHLDTSTAQAIADEVLTGDRAVLWITHGTVGLDQVDLTVTL